MRYVGIICVILSLLILATCVSAQTNPVPAEKQYLPIRLIVVKFADAGDMAWLFGGSVFQGGGRNQNNRGNRGG